MKTHDRAMARSSSFSGERGVMFRLKYNLFCFIFALVLGLGCSKQPDDSPVKSAKTPRVATPTSVVSRPPDPLVVTATPSTEATTRDPLPATKTINGDTAPANTPHSPSEIAQIFKTTGDKQAALAAIRQYAVNNPTSLGEMTALLKSSDQDIAMLGAEGLASLGTKEAVAQLIGVIQAAQPGNFKRQLTSALANFNNPDSANLFLTLIASCQDRELGAAIQRALGNSANGPVLNEVVQRFQATKSAEERGNLIAAIRQMQNPSCVEGLIAILNEQKVVSSFDSLGLAAADTLGIIGCTNAVNYLFAQLNNVRPGDTSPVYDAIGRVSNPESLPLLASIAYSQVAGSTLYARTSAVQALGNYNSTLVATTLNWLIQNDTSAGIKEAARVALQKSAGR